MLTAARPCGRVRSDTICFVVSVSIILIMSALVKGDKEIFCPPDKRLSSVGLAFGLQTLGDLHDAAGAQALGPQLQELLRVLQRGDAPRGLDLDLGRAVEKPVEVLM